MSFLLSCWRVSLEFFLNEFHWIQRIQWIMTKSKSGMVTKVITHLLTDTLLVLVIKSAFSLLPLGRYLLPVTTRNRYQSTGSSGKFFFTTTLRNVTIVRCRMFQVTILVLDFVLIHWIHWIQRNPFRKNSIVIQNLLTKVQSDYWRAKFWNNCFIRMYRFIWPSTEEILGSNLFAGFCHQFQWIHPQEQCRQWKNKPGDILFITYGVLPTSWYSISYLDIW